MSEEWILNAPKGPQAAARAEADTSTDIVAEMNGAITRLKANFITTEGVDYSGMAQSPIFLEYVGLTHKLPTISPAGLPDASRKAFFINLYNCFTLHILVQKSKQFNSAKDIPGMWNSYSYRIGAHCLTLDDIEHGVLRSNRGHPAAKKAQFSEEDPRRELVISQFDPRIHFALNCGARSCPPIRIYEADRLDSQLDRAAKSFCSGEIDVDFPSKRIHLSKLFLWYRKDFGSDDIDAVKCLSEYVTDEKKKDFMQNIDSTCEVLFAEYDWATNSKLAKA